MGAHVHIVLEGNTQLEENTVATSRRMWVHTNYDGIVSGVCMGTCGTHYYIQVEADLEKG